MLFFAILIGIAWGLRNNWGRNAFDGAPVRENSLELWVPFLLFGVWVLAGTMFRWVITHAAGVGDAEVPVVGYVSVAASSLITAFLGLNLAAIFFTDGLKGFGLDFKTAKCDLKRAVAALIQIWPFITVAMLTSAYLVPRLTDGRVQMPKHPLLDFADTAGTPWVIVLIFFLAVVIAPLLEELLFRGFVQTKLSENLQSRWGAIVLTSIFFAIVHGGTLWMHWPALFMFSLALGYVYEKSGSLLQPLFLHSLFNFANLVLSLIVTMN